MKAPGPRREGHTSMAGDREERGEGREKPSPLFQFLKRALCPLGYGRLAEPFFWSIRNHLSCNLPAQGAKAKSRQRRQSVLPFTGAQ